MADKTSFEIAVEKLETAMRTNSVYASWVRFKIGSLDISTSDKNRNYFMSLSNNRNGSGQANDFTLNIAYVPSPEDNNSQEADIDRIDKELATSDKKCILQYGYTYPIELKSPEYEGQVLNYQVEIREGTLFYTITGISGIASQVERSIDTKQYINKKPTEIVEDVFNEYLSDNGYTLEFVDNCKGTDKEIEKLELTNDSNIFEFISNVLGQATYSEDNEDTSLSERSTYIYYIDDIKDSKKIFVERIDPTNTDNSTDVIFNWMSRENGNLVINFTTNFEGSVILAQNYDKDDDEFKKYGINSKGERVESYNVYIAPTDGDKSKDDENSAITTWAKATQYSYTATLTLVGIPSHVKISEKLRIIPLIYGKAHHTQGTYMITKISDQIDSGGFITTFELMKINPNGKEDKK